MREKPTVEIERRESEGCGGKAARIETRSVTPIDATMLALLEVQVDGRTRPRANG
jgi:hypothetical protein